MYQQQLSLSGSLWDSKVTKCEHSFVQGSNHAAGGPLEVDV